MNTTTIPSLLNLNLNLNLNRNLTLDPPEIKNKMKIKKTLVAALVVFAAGGAFAADLSLESAPPVVVRTEPVAGANQIDPRTSEIVVRFSKPMQDASWSWSTYSPESYPATTGQPSYVDQQTCVLPVKLQPNRFYALWLNSDRFKNFKDPGGRAAVPYLLTFTTGEPPSASTPQVTRDNVAVEHLALQLLAAIRDKEDNALKELAVDRVKGWREVLPQFAFELRERVQQLSGKPFALTVGESLVEGDYAAVKCDAPAEFEGKYLVLFFVKTEQGWRNCSLRNSPPGIPLSKHLANCMAEMQKLGGNSSPPDAAWQRLLTDDQRAVLAWTDRQFRSYFDARTFAGWSDTERATLETKLIDSLKGPQSREYFQAINTLGAMRSTNGLPALRAIAYDRADKNNRDRWMAIRSLGMIDDPADVPELIALVYHGNVNTRWWAQLSLVRMTSQNFGSDWNAWGKWWNAQNGRPPYQSGIIRWWNGQAEPDKLAQSLQESDQKFLSDLRAKATPAPATK